MSFGRWETVVRFRLVLLGITLGMSALSFAGPALASPVHGSRIGQPAELTAPDGVGGDSAGWATAVSGTTAIVGAYDHNVGTGAAYVYTGPPWTQQAELTAANAQGEDHFGEAVAIDGDTAVIGAPGVNGGTGAVYVFDDAGGTWTQDAELTAADGLSGDQFGQALALSGTALVIGAPGRNTRTGAAYVFTGSGATWTQDAELNAPDGQDNDGFGSSIALSGTTAVVGSPNAQASGTAYVFSEAGTTWSEQAELTEGPSGSAGDGFGTAIALSGSSVLVGAPGSADLTGAVYPFSFTGASWQPDATLTASNGEPGSKFGVSLALSDQTALIGSSGATIGQGAAYFFTSSSGASWTQITEIKASDKRIGNFFGDSVSLSGTTAVVGAYGRDKYAGASYVFTQSKPTKWTQQAELLASDGQGGGDSFGSSTAVSGKTIVVGAPGRLDGQGAAYIYTLNDSTWSLDAELADPGKSPGDMFGHSVAISGSTVVIGAFGTNGDTGAAYVYQRSTNGWSLPATLTASDQHGGDDFGYSVAVSGPTALVGAYGLNQATGAAYVFGLSRGSWSQRQELTAPDGQSKDEFGYAVGVSPSAIVVGAPGSKLSAGVAYFYGLDGATWTQQAVSTGSDPPGPGPGPNIFGASVAVAGTTAVIGAPGENASNNINGHPGTAYVFVANAGAWSQQAQIEGSDLGLGAVYGVSVAISATAGTVAVGTPGHNAADMFNDLDGTWSQVYEQLGTFGDYGDNYGHSVAVSQSRLVVGVPGDNSRSGIVLVTGL